MLFRASPKAHELYEKLSTDMGISKTALFEIAIREMESLRVRLERKAFLKLKEGRK